VNPRYVDDFIAAFFSLLILMGLFILCYCIVFHVIQEEDNMVQLFLCFYPIHTECICITCAESSATRGWALPSLQLLVNTLVDSPSLTPKESKIKVESPIWKLIFNCNNFQNIFLLFKNVGHDFFRLLIHVTFLEASWVIYSKFYRYESSHIWLFGHLRIKAH